MEENVVLTVPAQRAYLLVIRTALGGVALVNDLDVDTLDDLRQAADEACDCLMHRRYAPAGDALCFAGRGAGHLPRPRRAGAVSGRAGDPRA